MTKYREGADVAQRMAQDKIASCSPLVVAAPAAWIANVPHADTPSIAHMRRAPGACESPTPCHTVALTDPRTLARFFFSSSRMLRSQGIRNYVHNQPGWRSVLGRLSVQYTWDRSHPRWNDT